MCSKIAGAGGFHLEGFFEFLMCERSTCEIGKFCF